MKILWMIAIAIAMGLMACQQQPSDAASPPAASTATDDTTSARTFLSHVYASYHPDAPLHAMLPDEQVYAPALLAAMEANRKAYDGEVGYLDSDPLCQCQDTAQDLRALDFEITPLGAGRLRAAATLADVDNPLALDLTLSRHGDQWRVADIASPRAPSLLQALERDTRRATGEK
ncbi:MAG: DUF3828 domain-containing protein [Stenotrophomonas sp.]|uniref:DUF3828 domain-containing protein n=1 Tax=Stenotrophomonas sp. TaxID=69392 RepID=UPI003D6CA6B3